MRKNNGSKTDGQTSAAGDLLRHIRREHCVNDEATGEPLNSGLDDLKRAVHRVETNLGMLARSISLRRGADEAERQTTSTAAVPGPAAPSDLPLWMNARDIEAKIGLTVQRLTEFHRQGYVRKAKLGGSRQAAGLYNARDVLDALERIAAGYLPRKKRKSG